MKKLYFSVLFFLLFVYQTFSQCAMCKAAAESDLQNNPNSVTKGINDGILFLMVIPYILIAFYFRKEIIQFIKGKKKEEI
jgi:amino acid permease